MRPVGKRRLARCEVAAKPMHVPHVPVSNLLSPTERLNELIEYWDDAAGCGGFGGCRNLSFAPEPFSGAA